MQWFQIQEQMKSDVLFLDYVIFRIRKSDDSRVFSCAISKHQKADNTQGTRLQTMYITTPVFLMGTNVRFPRQMCPSYVQKDK